MKKPLELVIMRATTDRDGVLALLTPGERVEAAKSLVLMADDLRHISSLQKGGDPWALLFAQRLEQKATQLLEEALGDEASD